MKYLLEGDYLSVRYEDLCEKHNEVMNEILEFLGLKSENDFNGFIKQRKLELTPEGSFLKKFIFKRMKKYFTYFGYSI